MPSVLLASSAVITAEESPTEVVVALSLPEAEQLADELRTAGGMISSQIQRKIDMMRGK